MVRLAFAAVALLTLCLSCLGGAEQVRMGTEGAYEPYNFLNDAGEVVGFEREFAHENIAANAGKLAVVGPEVPLDSGIGIGLREEDSELKQKLDRAIASMKEDGSLNALIRKWFDEDADTF